MQRAARTLHRGWQIMTAGHPSTAPLRSTLRRPRAQRSALRRLPSAAFLVPLLLVACIGPFRRGEESGRTSRSAATNYWSAIALLELEQAAQNAPDADHQHLAEALQLLLLGRMPEAAEQLRRLSRSAGDSLVRGIAKARLASILVYEQNWDALARLAVQHADALPVRVDRSSFVTWAMAMRGAPRPSYPAIAGLVSIPITRSPSGVPVIVARVNGCTRRLWIDTGASTSLVSSSVARSCGIHPLVPDTLEMLTSTGRVAARPAVIGQVEMGGLSIDNLQAAIVSDEELRLGTSYVPGRPAFERIDGILGFDVLRRYDVEIDFDRGRMLLRRPGDRGGSTLDRRNLFWLGYPVVRLTHASGSSVYFGLDTGADYSFATSNLLLKLPRSYLSRGRHRIAGIGGDTTATLPVLHHQEFTVGRTLLRFGELPIRDLHWLLLIELDGILGSDIGAVGRIRFDMSSGAFTLGPSH